MADRNCWNCGYNLNEAEADAADRLLRACPNCGAKTRDVRCWKCLRPLFLSTDTTETSCPFCGKRGRVLPGELSLRKVGLFG